MLSVSIVTSKNMSRLYFDNSNHRYKTYQTITNKEYPESFYSYQRNGTLQNNNTVSVRKVAHINHKLSVILIHILSF